MADYQRNTKLLIANNLKRFMLTYNKTRKEVCEALDIRYTTFSDWINGKTYPRIEALEKLADYFGMQVGDFFVDVESPDTGAEERIMSYAMRLNEIPLETIKNLSDQQIKTLLLAGVRIRKKSLEEYISESGHKKMIASRELDWGKPVGDEVW